MSSTYLSPLWERIAQLRNLEVLEIRSYCVPIDANVVSSLVSGLPRLRKLNLYISLSVHQEKEEDQPVE